MIVAEASVCDAQAEDVQSESTLDQCTPPWIRHGFDPSMKATQSNPGLLFLRLQHLRG